MSEAVWVFGSVRTGYVQYFTAKLWAYHKTSSPQVSSHTLTLTQVQGCTSAKVESARGLPRGLSEPSANTRQKFRILQTSLEGIILNLQHCRVNRGRHACECSKKGRAVWPLISCRQLKNAFIWSELTTLLLCLWARKTWSVWGFQMCSSATVCGLQQTSR